MNILALQILQIILSVLAVIAILLQPKDQNLGGSAFGGMSGGEFYKSRRGVEKILHYGTIILVIAIVINSIALTALS